MKITYWHYRVITGAVYYVILPFVVLLRWISGGKYIKTEQRFGFFTSGMSKISEMSDISGEPGRGTYKKSGRKPDIKSWRLHAYSGKRIWIHASSVGETGAACAIIDEIMKVLPDADIALSTVTATGHDAAIRLAPEKVKKIMAPLDFEPAVKRTLDFITPDVLVLTETELWPNMIMAAHERKIKVITVNGRISDSSYRIYSRLKPFTEQILSVFSAFSMISGADAGRINKLGADPSTVFINGNSKYDQALRISRSTDEIKKADMLADILDARGRTVITAGSTRPGEEEIILRAFRRISETVQDALLVIAPRHIKRSGEVMNLPDMNYFSHSLRSSPDIIHVAGASCHSSCIESGMKQGRPGVVVLDTMGELAAVYRLSHTVICGGSLLPYGGQNPLEAAVLGKPSVLGPFMQDFAEEAEVLLKSGAAVEAGNADELYSSICSIINNPDTARKMGEAACSAVNRKAGAAAGHAGTVLQHLNLVCDNPNFLRN